MVIEIALCHNVELLNSCKHFRTRVDINPRHDVSSVVAERVKAMVETMLSYDLSSISTPVPSVYISFDCIEGILNFSDNDK